MKGRKCTMEMRGALRDSDPASQSNVTSASIRYYARSGLLKPARDSINEYRVFAQTDCERVSFIRESQAMGLTLSDLCNVLGKIEDGEPPDGELQVLLSTRALKIGGKIFKLQMMLRNATQALHAWSDLDQQWTSKNQLSFYFSRLYS